MNVLTIKLAVGMGHPNVLVNSVCPGWVRTDMGGPMASRSVEQGAETLIWAATLAENGPSAESSETTIQMIQKETGIHDHPVPTATEGEG